MVQNVCTEAFLLKSLRGCQNNSNQNWLSFKWLQIPVIWDTFCLSLCIVYYYVLHQIQHILAKYAHLPKHKFFAFTRRLEKAPSGFISLQQWNFFWLLFPLHICGFPNRVFTVRCNFHINILFETALLLTTVKAKKNMENWWVPPRSIERFARVQYPLKYRDDPESTPAWLNFSKSNNTLCQQKEGASFFPFSESLL